jgi:hypothetical protein
MLATALRTCHAVSGGHDMTAVVTSAHLHKVLSLRRCKHNVTNLPVPFTRPHWHTAARTCLRRRRHRKRGRLEHAFSALFLLLQSLHHAFGDTLQPRHHLSPPVVYCCPRVGSSALCGYNCDLVPAHAINTQLIQCSQRNRIWF